MSPGACLAGGSLPGLPSDDLQGLCWSVRLAQHYGLNLRWPFPKLSGVDTAQSREGAVQGVVRRPLPGEPRVVSREWSGGPFPVSPVWCPGSGQEAPPGEPSVVLGDE